MSVLKAFEQFRKQLPRFAPTPWRFGCWIFQIPDEKHTCYLRWPAPVREQFFAEDKVHFPGGIERQIHYFGEQENFASLAPRIPSVTSRLITGALPS